MCEFCAEHGEGKLWYLTMRNYGEELLAQDNRRQQITAFFHDFEARTARSLSMLDRVQALPFLPNIVGRVATARQKTGHFGQVVPVEDVDRILDLVNTFVRLPCACRSLTTGRHESRYCFGLGVDVAGLIGQFPDYAEKLEHLTREQARAAIHRLDQDGLVHSVWTFGTPFIGGLCNCDQDCVAYRLQVSTSMMQVFFPAEYEAVIDWTRCNGCKQCRSQCPFGAIQYSAAQDKCQIDPARCYGCGLCRAVCHRDAIRLQPRQRPFRWQPSRPALVDRTLRPSHQVIVQPCTNPRECRACIEACPAGVLGTVPQQQRAPGRPAGDWAVQVLTPSRCTGCGACVEVCPEGVIAVD